MPGVITLQGISGSGRGTIIQRTGRFKTLLHAGGECVYLWRKQAGEATKVVYGILYDLRKVRIGKVDRDYIG